MKVLDKLRSVAGRLSGGGVPDAPKEAEVLVTEALGIERADLYSGRAELTQDECARLDELTERRLTGEPLQYIVGHILFWGLTIRVGPGVLIPRPETELLVETALEVLTQRPVSRGWDPGIEERDLPVFRPVKSPAVSARILDVCTGSGCIALALAKRLPSAIVYGVEKSGAALHYALINARENGLDNACFIQGDLFDPLGPARFQCIVSNPPYIRSGDIAGLQSEVRDFEPREALDGGMDGLSFYRRILAGTVERLSTQGVLLLEVGWGQAAEIRALASAAGMGKVSFVRDFAGIERIAVVRSA
jgi:release factor glutamine methyltransferase